MAHEITERADGTAEAAFALTPAWHGLGTVLDHPMSSEEALTIAQLDWTVEQRDVYLRKIDPVPSVEDPLRFSAWQDGERTELAGALELCQNHLANVRSDNGFFLGLVSDRYQLVQNVEAFAFLDELIENRDLEYESAFSLQGGKKVVLLGRLPRVDEIVPNDSVLRYVLMSLSHDGTGAIRFGPCATRVVCMNTYSFAVGEGWTRELSVSHTGDVRDKLNHARHILNVAGEQFDAYAGIGRELAKRAFARDEWTRFLDVMCPEPSPDDPDWTERRAERILETRIALTERFCNERQLLEGIGGTAWAAFNAVTEHVDHLPRRGATSRRKAEARFNVALYGPGRDMKRRALEAACRISGVEFALTA